MITLFAGIVALIALIVIGFFFPFLWIIAGVLLVVGLLYAWQLARGAATEGTEDR